MMLPWESRNKPRLPRLAPTSRTCVWCGLLNISRDSGQVCQNAQIQTFLKIHKDAYKDALDVAPSDKATPAVRPSPDCSQVMNIWSLFFL